MYREAYITGEDIETHTSAELKWLNQLMSYLDSEGSIPAPTCSEKNSS